MNSVCNCTDLNRITEIVNGLVKEATEEKEHLGNRLWVIVLAYTFVILPWGLLYNIDFISEKWRTIHRTRFLGRVHLVFAIAPMPFIMYYAHLQRTSEDYKEMMAAVIAILMSLYHVFRTVWGLIQLASFSKWCYVLAERMWRMEVIDELEFGDYIRDEEVEQVTGIQGFIEEVVNIFKKGCNYFFKNVTNLSGAKNGVDNESEETEIHIEAEKTNDCNILLGNVDKILKVNNTLLDNEMGGTDMTVKFGIWKILLKTPMRAYNAVVGDESLGTQKSVLKESELLTIEEKELCLVRWSGSFLSSFGEYWSGLEIDPKDHDEIFEKCKWSLAYLDVVTFPVNKKKVSFSMVKWRDGGPYASPLDITGLGGAPLWLKQRKRLLENLMGEFPGSSANQNLRRADVSIVYSLVYAQSIDDVTIDALFDYRSKFNLTASNNGWSLLLWQTRELPPDFQSDEMEPLSIPPFPWRKLFVPLWDKCTNWRVLQASVHVDNCGNTPLCWGDIAEESNLQARCWYEYFKNKYLEEAGIRYVGTVLESVRTFLAVWISHQTRNSIHPNWCPTLPIKSVQFSINQDIILDEAGFMVDSCRDVWRWECQSKLQETIGSMDMHEVTLPSSSCLILLFILGLPGYLTEQDENSCITLDFPEIEGLEKIGGGTEVSEGVLLHSLEFLTDLAPQDIKVRIRIFEVEGKEEKIAEIGFINVRSAQVFRWEDWINAVMGFMKSQDDALGRTELQCETFPWRKRTPRKVNLSNPLVSVRTTCESVPNTMRGDIRIWTGWPFFDIKIVQFEMNEWLRASGCLNGYSEMVLSDDYNFEEEVQNAEEGLKEISEWDDSKWKSIMEENEKEIESVPEIV